MSRPLRKIKRRLNSLRLSKRRDAAAIARLVTVFDAKWYLNRYPDVSADGTSPLRHFREHGFGEGRQPNRFIDPEWYSRIYKDVGSKPALLHYAQTGWRERRDPGPHFSISGYLEAYPDVAADGIHPLLHYIRHGRAEGRLTFRPQPVGQGTLAPVLETLFARFAFSDPVGRVSLHVADETLLRIKETMLRRGTRVLDGKATFQG